MASAQGVFDKGEKSSRRMTGNDVERNHGIADANEVFVVCVEDAEIVLDSVVGGGSDFLKSERCEPFVDLLLSDGEDVETRLRGDDAYTSAGLRLVKKQRDFASDQGATSDRSELRKRGATRG